MWVIRIVKKKHLKMLFGTLTTKLNCIYFTVPVWLFTINQSKPCRATNRAIFNEDSLTRFRADRAYHLPNQAFNLLTLLTMILLTTSSCIKIITNSIIQLLFFWAMTKFYYFSIDVARDAAIVNKLTFKFTYVVTSLVFIVTFITNTAAKGIVVIIVIL